MGFLSLKRSSKLETIKFCSICPTTNRFDPLNKDDDKESNNGSAPVSSESPPILIYGITNKYHFGNHCRLSAKSSTMSSTLEITFDFRSKIKLTMTKQRLIVSNRNASMPWKFPKRIYL